MPVAFPIKGDAMNGEIGFGADERPAFSQGAEVMVYSGNTPMGVGVVSNVYKADGHYRYVVNVMGAEDVYLSSQLATYGGPRRHFGQEDK